MKPFPITTEKASSTRSWPLDTAAMKRYQTDGFAELPGVLSPAEVSSVLEEASGICRGDFGPIRGAMPALHRENDDEVLQRHLCIHMPHKISSLILNHIRHPSLISVLTQVIGPNVKCMQTMLFIKAAGKPGQAWHQDEAYIPTRDRSLTGVWISLDDATLDNGCLWVIPGSHKHGILWPQRPHSDRQFDCTHESFDFPYTDRDAIPVPLRSGSALVFNGYLLHRSLPNRTPKGYRRSLVNHYMSAESLLPWHPPLGGEYMGTLDYRDIVMVAGKDPYAHKGVRDLARPHVRPSGEGGCGDPKHNVVRSANAASPNDPAT